jgi:hypothetical protein
MHIYFLLWLLYIEEIWNGLKIFCSRFPPSVMKDVSLYMEFWYQLALNYANMYWIPRQYPVRIIYSWSSVTTGGNLKLTLFILDKKKIAVAIEYFNKTQNNRHSENCKHFNSLRLVKSKRKELKCLRFSECLLFCVLLLYWIALSVLNCSP